MMVGIILLGSSGCVKHDSMEGIEIITSSYPIEYLVDKIYGEKATIKNIYPDGEKIDTYNFNNKQFKNFSKKDLFVYNGKNASDIALELINRNNKILLIDSTLGMRFTYGIEEIWLDPFNMLMMALNIRDGLEEYVSNSYLRKKIDEQYKNLEIILSELDAEYKLVIQNADTDQRKIVVDNEALKYLEKYGLEVIVLNDKAIDKTYEDVRKLIKDGTIKTIYTFEKTELDNKVKDFIIENKIKETYLNRLDWISDEERKNGNDYIILMNNNLELLKNELYN